MAKSAKSKLKNPFKLMKEPVNSIPEAQQRKKDLVPWLIISGVLCILFVGFFFLFYFGLGYMVANKIIKRFECFTCNSCNEVAKLETKEDFDKYITYEIVEQKAVFKGVEHPASDDSGRVAYIKATVTGKAVVLVHLTCPKCGAKKDLVYTVKTFEAKREEKNVPVRQVAEFTALLENAMNTVVAHYNNAETRDDIPFTIHSVHHPRYEQRTKPQFGSIAEPYAGVGITYHRTIEELLEGYFTGKEVNGDCKDPSKSKK
jgi:DNA-directed RNA polymerase subunit M/transcription elongation factor TFIIS